MYGIVTYYSSERNLFWHKTSIVTGFPWEIINIQAVARSHDHQHGMSRSTKSSYFYAEHTTNIFLFLRSPIDTASMCSRIYKSFIITFMNVARTERSWDPKESRRLSAASESQRNTKNHFFEFFYHLICFQRTLPLLIPSILPMNYL